MKELIDKYSRGNIDIKFKIVVPMINNRKRRIILTIGLIIFLLFSFYLIPKALNNLQLTGFSPMGLTFGIFLLLYDLVTRKWVFQIKEVGVIKFLSDTLEIKLNDNSTIYSFPYSDIKGIRYKHNVPKTVVTRFPNTKTFIIEFVRYNQSSIVVELEKNMFLTSDDKNQFRTLEPDIEVALSHIKTKYGVETVKKITTPNTGFALVGR